MTDFTSHGDPAQPGENSVPEPAPTEFPAINPETDAPPLEEIPPVSPVEFPLDVPEPSTDQPPLA